MAKNMFVIGDDKITRAAIVKMIQDRWPHVNQVHMHAFVDVLMANKTDSSIRDVVTNVFAMICGFFRQSEQQEKDVPMETPWHMN